MTGIIIAITPPNLWQSRDHGAHYITSWSSHCPADLITGGSNLRNNKIARASCAGEEGGQCLCCVERHPAALMPLKILASIFKSSELMKLQFGFFCKIEIFHWAASAI